MKSFIPWCGGKSALAKQIVPLLPDDIQRYVEVFGGGGSVMFYGNQPRAPLEIYNDFNHDLVNLFRCVKYHCTELQREIDGYFNCREWFDDIKKQMEIKGFTDIQRAAMFYFMVKISFGAKINDFGCNKKTLSTDYLPAISERLKKVVIENKNFENLIRNYDRPNALFYCDPPYFKTEYYYDIAFSEDDHKRLKRCLSNIKGKFVLSYNDCEFARDLYRDFDICSVERTNNLYRGTYKELIIKNY